LKKSRNDNHFQHLLAKIKQSERENAVRKHRIFTTDAALSTDPDDIYVRLKKREIDSINELDVQRDADEKQKKSDNAIFFPKLSDALHLLALRKKKGVFFASELTEALFDEFKLSLNDAMLKVQQISEIIPEFVWIHSATEVVKSPRVEINLNVRYSEVRERLKKKLGVDQTDK